MKRSKQTHQPSSFLRKVKPQAIITPFEKKMAILARESKGKHINYAFVCNKCGNKHISGYLFTDKDGNEYEICKYCCKKHDYMNILTTPMRD